MKNSFISAGFDFEPCTNSFQGAKNGKRGFCTKDRVSQARMVDSSFYWYYYSLYPWAPFMEVNMLRHFMRFKLGWWILHIIAISLTFYLGHMVRFEF